MTNNIDISEDNLHQIKGLLEILLKDHTTQENIFWATDSYAKRGKGYAYNHPITIEAITGNNARVIMPRAKKSAQQQLLRTKKMAEVFTPAWIVNKMTDVIDHEFRYAHSNNHVANNAKPAWQQYVLSTMLEITCGEAPFLTSRYDSVTGEAIPLNNRLGLLDRKLSLINSNTHTEQEWTRWALLALGSVYGYEWQGDSLLLAREALLSTFCEYYAAKFNDTPNNETILKAAEIISWNLWQMDGLKGVVPLSCHEGKKATYDLFGNKTTTITPCPGCANNNIGKHNGHKCQLRRWIPNADGCIPQYFCCQYTHFFTKQFTIHNNIKYTMKFDFVIGNPPFNEETDRTSDKPLYNYFMDSTYKISDKVMLITPARFLFNAGKTPKAWNEKMLADKHLKVCYYYQVSAEVFCNTDIKGGVAITYHNNKKDFGAIEVFTNYMELNDIRIKVENTQEFNSLSSIIYTSDAYHFTDTFHTENPDAKSMLSKGHENDVTTNIFIKLPNVFIEENKDRDKDKSYIKVHGLEDNNRVVRWIKRVYLNNTSNLDFWKVFLPKSNGSGKFGEILSNPFVAEPGEGHTQTFMSIGKLNTKQEAENLLKYIKTKFARTMLGILKITQHNPISTWKYVPLQDFTCKSDIDWSKSIAEIDAQLYDKYQLTKAERLFIETHVKQMS